MTQLTLVSHALCPYVQRIAIALAEKGVAHDRVEIDLADKPAWFLALSPLGRTPVLRVGEAALFESAAILEYLEETRPCPLHPADPVARAQARAWIGFASEVLDDIAGFYSAPDAAALEGRAARLAGRFRTVERALGPGPWFSGARFGLVDAAFAPVFRYFDVFDRIGAFGVLDGLARVGAWRRALAARPSVKGAVAADYPERLMRFIDARGSHLSARLRLALGA